MILLTQPILEKILEQDFFFFSVDETNAKKEAVEEI